MQYAKTITAVREALIDLQLDNWGKPARQLFSKTDVSGWELWLAFSHNNFNNPCQQADEQRYKSRRLYGRGLYVELFRDTAREGGRGVDDKGRLDIIYVSHADTEWQKEHTVWAPKPGWCVPTGDGIFVSETAIPFETLRDKKEAIRRLEAKGIPGRQASYFCRPERYVSEMYVGRSFGPVGGGVGDGQFAVNAGMDTLNSGNARMASRPAYDPLHDKTPEIVMVVQNYTRN